MIECEELHQLVNVTISILQRAVFSTRYRREDSKYICETEGASYEPVNIDFGPESSGES